MPAIPKFSTSIISPRAYYNRLQKIVNASLEFLFDSMLMRTASWALNSVGRQMRKQNAIVDNVAIAIEKSPDVAPILQQTTMSNLYYASAAVGASMFFPPVSAVVPISSSMLTALESKVLTAWCVYLVFSNALYNLALAKALEPYIPARSKDSSIPLSTSGLREKLEANLANSVLYLCLLLMASGANLVTATLPELLQTPGLLLQAIAYGYVLAGMQYSAHGLAANESSAVLNNNKIYYIGIGAALIYTVKKTTTMVENFAQISPNFFLEDAIFSLAWQQSIMLVMLQQPTEDYFKYPREFVQRYINARVKNFLKDLKETTISSNFMGEVNKILVSGEMRSLLSLKPVQMVVDVHHQELAVALEWILWVRANKADKLASWLDLWLPDWEMLKEFRLFTKIVKQQNWEQTSILVHQHLADIATRREIDEGMIKLHGTINIVDENTYDVTKEDERNIMLAADVCSALVPQPPLEQATSLPLKLSENSLSFFAPSTNNQPSSDDNDDFLEVDVSAVGTRTAVSFRHR